VIILSGALGAVALADQKERTWEKSDGDFRLKFGVSLKGDKVEAAWAETEPSAMPEFEEITQVRRGQEFTLFLLFANCASDATKRCRATVDYSLLGPKGDLLVERKGLRLWTKPLPAKDQVRLGAAVLRMNAEEKDPPGMLTLRAVVTDPVAKKTVVLERSFELLP
jgi:hypothetical protein